MDRNIGSYSYIRIVKHREPVTLVSPTKTTCDMETNKFNSIFVLALCAFVTTTSCEDNGTVPKNEQFTNCSTNQKAAQTERVTNYTFDGTEGDPITLEVAKGWITNYSGLNPGTSSFLSNKVIPALSLEKQGASESRIYYSVDDNSNQVLLMIGTDGTNET